MACASFCSAGDSLLCSRRRAREELRGEMRVGSGEREVEEEEEEDEPDDEEEEKEQEDEGGETTSRCSSASSSLMVAALCSSSTSSSQTSSSLSSLHADWGDRGDVEKRLLLVEQWS